MISNGAETNVFRDIAVDVRQRLSHLFTYEMPTELQIIDWDYRLDMPRIVPLGGLPARSLTMVDEADAVLAIFGGPVTEIARQEVRHSFEVRQQGRPLQLWAFVDAGQPEEERTAFFAELRDEFGEEIVYTKFSNALEFQAMVFVTLTKFALEHLNLKLARAEYLP